MKTMENKKLQTKQSTCADCASHCSGQLTKLGIDMEKWDYVVSLAGNPNTGKSTIFNALTGLRQHTGNWPGKTVTRAEGGFEFGGDKYKLVDLPGTYSLLATSLDEEVARNFILFGQPDVTIIVADATRLEQNLNLILQVLEITDRAVLALNLMDEAKRHGITVDYRALARSLGIPVVPTQARTKKGIPELLQAVAEVASGKYVCRPHRMKDVPASLKNAVDELLPDLKAAFPDVDNAEWVSLRLLDADKTIIDSVKSGDLGDLTVDDPASSGTASAAATNKASLLSKEKAEKIDTLLAKADALRLNVSGQVHEKIVEDIYAEATRICQKVVIRPDKPSAFNLDRTIDRLVTSRIFGFPLMILLFTGVFWLTIAGANVPSSMLATLFLDTIYPALKNGAAAIGMPWWLSGFLIDGVYLATGWVISVMLPPMAIFFPLFTLLEDFGYLPRVAFNLDKMFKRTGAHGKQSLSMMMGFGCNAAGVIAARVIDSPRERLIAIITNNFALCNGRWPTQILIATLFLGALVPAYLAGFVSAAAVVFIAVLGVLFSFAVSWWLSRTMLKGEASTFSLELPPYRPPRILQTIYTSLIDRTLLVLWRAIIFAMPAGAVTWLICNINIGQLSIAQHLINFFEPFGWLLGLNGVIILAYIVAIPANEIVIPTVLMLTVLTTGMSVDGAAGAGVMFEIDDPAALMQLFSAGGWSLLTAVNLMLFSLLHNPCSTTIYTIYKETGSKKWTWVASLLPVVIGIVVTFVVAQVWRLVAMLT